MTTDTPAPTGEQPATAEQPAAPAVSDQIAVPHPAADQAVVPAADPPAAPVVAQSAPTTTDSTALLPTGRPPVWAKPAAGAAWGRALPQELPAPPGASRVAFTGSRWELAGLMLRGFLLMIPTLGLFRFWQQTARRRFYWQNTVIAGEPLEYTGTAAQLLIGFLLALVFFLPIYVGLFILSTQPRDILLLGYGVLLTVLWFLNGYATYRGRYFRLSRTLWRGIRFRQTGSAWLYALRQFGWTLLMIVTLGLIFPLMAADLWRYRYRHTWYGDRNFSFEGRARQLAAPYYVMYVINVVAVAATSALIAFGSPSASGFQTVASSPQLLAQVMTLVVLGLLGFFNLTYAWFRCVETTRMMSSVKLGDVGITMRVKFGPLLLQYVLNTLAVAGAIIAFGIVIAVVVFTAIAASKGGAPVDPRAVARMFGSGTVSGIALIGLYLALLATISLLSEIILACGWWILLARGALVSNVASLNSVRSTPEDRTLVGEGLADALNVGAY